MKFKRLTRLEKETAEFDMIPLINCVFLLLIFFLLISSYVIQPGVIKVQLPRAVTGEAVHEKSLVITITSEDDVYLNERKLTPDELTSRLRIAAKEDESLLITADRHASLGKVVEIWDLCREEGVTKINIATSQKIR